MKIASGPVAATSSSQDQGTCAALQMVGGAFRDPAFPQLAQIRTQKELKASVPSWDLPPAGPCP